MRGRGLVLIGASILLSGCIALPCGRLSGCPAPSSAYLQIEGLPSDEQSAIAATLTLEQRLDAYHDVYVRSGHPRTMLREPFEGSGEAGIQAVLARMTSNASFNEYFWIIHWLEIRGEVDICAPHIFDRLTEKALQFDVRDPKHPVPIEFDGCVLPL